MVGFRAIPKRKHNTSHLESELELGGAFLGQKDAGFLTERVGKKGGLEGGEIEPADTLRTGGRGNDAQRATGSMAEPVFVEAISRFLWETG